MVRPNLPVWLQSVAVCCLAMSHHPLRFPLNWLNDKLLRCQPGIERLKLPRCVSNSQYYVYRKTHKSRTVILKLPRFKHVCRFDLYEWRREIARELSDPLWNAHFPVVFGFRKDGSYEMEYVEGENLFVLYECLRSEQEVIDGSLDLERLLGAIDVLLNNLKAYQAEHGVLKGEWKHHNLIYDERAGIIKNVDIEALVSYVDISWAHIESAERNLLDLRRVVAMAMEAYVCAEKNSVS